MDTHTEKKRTNTTKRDWLDLRREYVQGDIKSLSKYFKSIGLPRTTWAHKTAGWRDLREQYRIDTNSQAAERNKENEIATLATLRKQQSKVVQGSYQLYADMFKTLRAGANALRKKIDGLIDKNEDVPDALWNQFNNLYKQVMNYIPTHVKTNELLAGRATERSLLEDKTRKELEDKKRDFDSKRARLESIGAKPYLIQRGKGGKGSEDEDGPIPDDVDPDDIKDTPEAAAG